jgi:hypothetical protein
MSERAHFRVQHLRRLTDRVGLLRRAEFGEPDSFSGYDTLDNGLALRLATRLFALGMHDDATAWASTYLQFLFQAFRSGTGFCAHRGPLGTWPDQMLSVAELAQVARGLAAASHSELPGVARGRADTLWNNVVPDLSGIRCPRAAAHWLLAISERPPAEQRKLEDAAARLANWLIEDCYYALRTSDWEWFDERWLPGDACLPHALWAAHTILGDQRYARVAANTTAFLIGQLFEDGLTLPVGTRGGWPRHRSKMIFDQLPSDVAATVELLAYAYDATGSAEYAEYANYAYAWFTGNNIKGLSMLDDTTGGAYDSLTAAGHAPGQGATAIVSFLLSATAIPTMGSPRVVDMGTVISVI